MIPVRRTLIVLTLAACASPKENVPKTADTAAATAHPIAGAPPGAATCPATGLWAQCSVLYRLERAGFATHLDSTEKAEEKALHGDSFVIKIGANTRLEVFLYADTLARATDAAKLDRKKFVDAAAPQTINRERTLIQNANLIGLLTSLNDKMRERVSDALTAGAPQPPSAK